MVRIFSSKNSKGLLICGQFRCCKCDNNKYDSSITKPLLSMRSLIHSLIKIQNFYRRFDEAKTCRMLLHYYHTANSHWRRSAHCYEIQYTICILQHSKWEINIPTISPLPSCGWKNWLQLIYSSNLTFLFYSLWKKGILGIFRK